jgi:hypothetical protein
MTPDDEAAALAQKELEERRRQEESDLSSDPGYLEFLAKVIETEMEKANEIRRKSQH